jgi:hypothetical protein
MVFHRQPTEGFLQFDFGDAALDAQHFVVVTLAHSCFHTALLHSAEKRRWKNQTTVVIQHTARARIFPGAGW